MSLTIPDEISSAGPVQDFELVQCEWPVANWHGEHAPCARSGVKTPYTMALCWQHEDALWSHVLYSIRYGERERLHIKDLTDALLETRRYDGSLHEKTASWSDAIDDEIARRIRSRHYSPVVREAVDELIQSRLQDQWGSL